MLFFPWTWWTVSTELLQSSLLWIEKQEACDSESPVGNILERVRRALIALPCCQNLLIKLHPLIEKPMLLENYWKRERACPCESCLCFANQFSTKHLYLVLNCCQIARLYFHKTPKLIFLQEDVEREKSNSLLCAWWGFWTRPGVKADSWGAT